MHHQGLLGKETGFDVVIIPHESSFAAAIKEDSFNTRTGVIGVACVLNLIAGGLMLKAKAIPDQCVLLDYCGCKNH